MDPCTGLTIVVVVFVIFGFLYDMLLIYLRYCDRKDK